MEIKPQEKEKTSQAQLAQNPQSQTQSPLKQQNEQQPQNSVVSYADFAKLSIKVATILSAQSVEGSDKLLKLEIKIGDEFRTLAAGIAKHYSPQDLAGKKIIVISNLAPRKIRGIESQGMLLAAFNGEGENEKLSLLALDRDLQDGSQIG